MACETLRDGRTPLLLLLRQSAFAFRSAPTRKANPSAFPAGRPSPRDSPETRPAPAMAAGLPGPPGAALSPRLSPPSVTPAAGLPPPSARPADGAFVPAPAGPPRSRGPARGGPCSTELGGKEGAPDPHPCRAGHKMAAPLSPRGSAWPLPLSRRGGLTHLRGAGRSPGPARPLNAAALRTRNRFRRFRVPAPRAASLPASAPGGA